MSEMTKYSVQIAVIREVEVEATDELQAEREAFQKLKPADREAAIALEVFDVEKNADNNDAGALADDTSDAWRYAREHFHAIDLKWVE